MSTKRVIEEIRRCVSCLEDPRVERRKLHSLFDIIVITLCGVICGCSGWQAIEENAKDREEWFRKFLELDNGIPSHDTIERIFRRLNPEKFQEMLLAVARCIQENFSGEVIPIDGKTLRRSFDNEAGIKRAHVVSAYAGRLGVTLAQVKTDVKSNEIKAIPQLLDMIDISGAIITIDAMGCQKDIADKIVEKEGDYVLNVKDNQPTLASHIEDYFTEVSFDMSAFADTPGVSTLSHTEKGHGRIEERSYIISQDTSWIPGITDWRGAKSIGMVIARRTIGEETSEERRIFLTSIDPDVVLFEKAVRGHWSIENSSHHVLDVTFHEDHSRIRIDNGPENMAVMRRLANGLLQNEKSTKRSVKGKILRANRSNEYLETVLRVQVDDYI